MERHDHPYPEGTWHIKKKDPNEKNMWAVQWLLVLKVELASRVQIQV